MAHHTYRRLRIGNIQPNSYQQPHAGYFMSIELRYHPLIPNRTCTSWDCPLFRNVTFEDIRITGAARAGDINGFLGDQLEQLTFRNVTFQQTPARGWTCGYVDLDSFVAKDVSPPLECHAGSSPKRLTSGEGPGMSSADPSQYSTNFRDRSSVLSQWTPQATCAHCGNSDGSKDECTNMTAGALAFGAEGMTITTRTVGSSVETSCQTERPVCSSGHMTWNPKLRYGNFSVVARWFPGGSGGSAKTATGFIGLDSDGNEASITMGFHGDEWMGDHEEGPHKYQHGIYADVSKTHNRKYTTTAPDISAGFHRYGLLWTPSLVEWTFDGAAVRRVTDDSIIPQIAMRLRLHTRSGYCDALGSSSFNATFSSFSYEPVALNSHDVRLLA